MPLFNLFVHKVLLQWEMEMVREGGVSEKTIIWHEWVVEEKYLNFKSWNDFYNFLHSHSLSTRHPTHMNEYIWTSGEWERKAEGRINKRIKSSQWKWKLCLSTSQCSHIHIKGLRLPVENLIRARWMFAWHPTAANIIISS